MTERGYTVIEDELRTDYEFRAGPLPDLLREVGGRLALDLAPYAASIGRGAGLEGHAAFVVHSDGAAPLLMRVVLSKATPADMKMLEVPGP